MTQNRKRGRNAQEDEVEFMPLSKRINNLHINSGLLFENTKVSQQSASAEWGPGPPLYNSAASYNPPDTPPESVHSLNFNDPNMYNPVLSESENPHYYFKNKLLFEMHLERMRRNGHSF